MGTFQVDFEAYLRRLKQYTEPDAVGRIDRSAYDEVVERMVAHAKKWSTIAYDDYSTELHERRQLLLGPVRSEIYYRECAYMEAEDQMRRYRMAHQTMLNVGQAARRRGLEVESAASLKYVREYFMRHFGDEGDFMYDIRSGNEIVHAYCICIPEEDDDPRYIIVTTAPDKACVNIPREWCGAETIVIPNGIHLQGRALAGALKMMMQGAEKACTLRLVLHSKASHVDICRALEFEGA